jgi:hypothetical protein
MTADPAVFSRRNRLNAMQRHHGRDDPRVVEMRREVAADAIARYVRKVVDEAPPLTADQRDAIAALLRPHLPAADDAA